jgi:hypothetical protein
MTIEELQNIKNIEEIAAGVGEAVEVGVIKIMVGEAAAYIEHDENGEVTAVDIFI